LVGFYLTSKFSKHQNLVSWAVRGLKNSNDTMYGVGVNPRETIAKPYLFAIEFETTKFKNYEVLLTSCGFLEIH